MAKSVLKQESNFFILLGIFIGVLIHLQYGEHFKHAIPYMMLLGSDRDSNLKAWEKYAPVNRKITYHATHVPEIAAEDYSFELLQEASNNFRSPVVVRGLFRESYAVAHWSTRDYLPAKMEGFNIPVVQDGTLGTLQNDRVVNSFADSFHQIYDADHTRQYIFFPVKSRFTFNGSDAGSAAALEERVNEVVKADLDLNKLWPGFGSTNHSSFAGAQFVIGKTNPSIAGGKFTGSNWHCAPGNNYFIQVAGVKRWEFIDPKYSAYLWPLKGGLKNMWTGNPNIAEDQEHIPTQMVDLQPGDMVFNPDWAWHKITNHPGFTIGVPVRAAMLKLPLPVVRNNNYFAFIILVSNILTKMGLSLGGYPEAISAATEADN